MDAATGMEWAMAITMVLARKMATTSAMAIVMLMATATDTAANFAMVTAIFDERLMGGGKTDSGSPSERNAG